MRQKLLYASFAFLFICLIASGIYLYTRVTAPKNPPVQKQQNSTIYFLNYKQSTQNEQCTKLYPVTRNIPTDDINKIAYQLTAGPTQEEINNGYFSPYDIEILNTIKDIQIKEKIAYVDFNDISQTISNKGSTRGAINVAQLIENNNKAPVAPQYYPECGIQAFEKMLEQTVKKAKNTNRVIFTIQGDPQKYYEWSQTKCDAPGNLCITKLYEKPEIQETETSLFENQLKITHPTDWKVESEDTIATISATKAKITITKTPSQKFKCPKDVGMECGIQKINEANWTRLNMYQMNGKFSALASNKTDRYFYITIESTILTDNEPEWLQINKVIETLTI